MTWNYRVLRHAPHGTGQIEESVSIVEMYYDDAGNPVAWAEATPHGEDLAEIKKDFALMIEAMDKEIIEEKNVRRSPDPDHWSHPSHTEGYSDAVKRAAEKFHTLHEKTRASEAPDGTSKG